MDGVVGSVTIKPDQVQIINPLLILALVPVFESLIYPLFAKCGLLTPLQRMGAGGVLAAIAFIFSGFLELTLEVHIQQSTFFLIRDLIISIAANVSNDSRGWLNSAQFHQWFAVPSEYKLYA